MPSALASQPAHRWWRLLRALVFGVALGLAQLALYSQAEKLANWALFWWPPLGIGTSACLYMFIPALAGFLSAWQDRDSDAGVSAGCLVGGASFLVILSAAGVACVMTLAAPLPTCSGFWAALCASISPDYGFALILAFLAATVAGIGGLGGGLLGGWMGGLLGSRCAAAADQNKGSEASHAL